jgi:hypothetical protein
LATRHDLDIEDLLDEPFLALPAEGRALRDYRLAIDSRNGHPLLIAAEIANAEETARHSRAGLGVCPLSAGNAPLIARDGVAIRPITGVTPSRLGSGEDRTRGRSSRTCAPQSGLPPARAARANSLVRPELADADQGARGGKGACS